MYGLQKPHMYRPLFLLEPSMSWSDDVRAVCCATIPYAFTVKGKRLPADQGNWNEAMTSLVGLVESMISKAYRQGYEQGALDHWAAEALPDEESVRASAKFLGERCFREFTKTL